MNGFRFHNNDIDFVRKTQGSGVAVTVAGVTFHDVLTNIIELDYTTGQKVVLFNCNSWYRTQKDKFGFMSVNFIQTISSDDPFVLASQIKQFLCVKESIDTNWRVVKKSAQ